MGYVWKVCTSLQERQTQVCGLNGFQLTFRVRLTQPRECFASRRRHCRLYEAASRLRHAPVARERRLHTRSGVDRVTPSE